MAIAAAGTRTKRGAKTRKKTVTEMTNTRTNPGMRRKTKIRIRASVLLPLKTKIRRKAVIEIRSTGGLE